MIKFMQGLANGPLLLTGAACSILAMFKIREQIQFGKIELKGEGSPKLITVMENLSVHADQEKRLEATKKLLEYIQGQRKADSNDAKDIVVDHGGLQLLVQIISQPDKQSDAILDNALQAIRLLVHGSSEQRHKFNSIGGVHQLFKLAISTSINSRTRTIAMATLRTATRFDVARRELDDDIPFGSESTLTIARESSDDLITLLTFLEQSDNQLLRATLGVIAHATQSAQGALHFNELGAFSKFVNHLRSSDPVLRKNALISMGNIVKHSIEKNIDQIDETSRRLIFASLSKDPKLNLKIKRAVIDCLLSIAQHHYKTQNAAEFANFAKIFQEQNLAENLNVMIYIGLTTGDRYLKNRIAQLEALLTDESFAPKDVVYSFTAQSKNISERIEVQRQQEAARKQQQMMQQMMGGMGGGMQGLSPQDLAMLQQMYM